MQRAVDESEGVPGLLVRQVPDGRAGARQHGRADEVPRAKVHVVDAAVVIEEAVDTPAFLPRVRLLVGNLVEARQAVFHPRWIVALLARAPEVLAVSLPEEPIELVEQVGSARDAPVAREHVLGRAGLGDCERVDRVAWHRA